MCGSCKHATRALGALLAVTVAKRALESFAYGISLVVTGAESD
jgi:hypothetical protein